MATTTAKCSATEAEMPVGTEEHDETEQDTALQVDDEQTPDVDTAAPSDDDQDDSKSHKRERTLSRLRKLPWRQHFRRSILPLLLAIALASCGFLGWKQWQTHQLALAGQQAQQAAVTYAQALTSIDSNNVDQNFRQVLDGATGEFKDMYTQSSVQLRQLLIENKATAHGAVVDSAIQSESTHTVVVLLFIDQTVTNTQLPDPRMDRSRIKMTMQKVDGRWLASKVQLL